MRPLTHAMPGALMYLLRETPLSDGKVDFAWDAAVGPALARATHVKLEGGVLIVEAASTQWALEVKRSTPVILGRLQALLGSGVVTSVSVRT
jgi:predicted nucleic acid-binding Zn ribbon protein